MPLNVIICNNVHLYAEGMQCLLAEDDEIRVLGIASNDQEIAKLIVFEPDIIISDMANCLNILKMGSNRDNKKVLLINDRADISSSAIKSMFDEGLGGILPKEASGLLLQKAVKKLAEGELWIDNQTIREVFRLTKQPHRDIHLTKKELDILNSICSGLTNKEIANRLFISEQTVKSHCNHLFKKFGVSSRLKLALCAPTYFPEGFSRMQ